MTEWIPISEGINYLQNFKLEYLEKKGNTYYYNVYYKENIVALYQYNFYGDIEEKNIKLLRSDLVSFRELFDFIA